MIKNITRSIEKRCYSVDYVNMDTMTIQQVEIDIFDLIDEKNILSALQNELKAYCNNSTYLKHSLTFVKKYKCSMPINYFIEHSNHTEIE